MSFESLEALAELMLSRPITCRPLFQAVTLPPVLLPASWPPRHIVILSIPQLRQWSLAQWPELLVAWNPWTFAPVARGESFQCKQKLCCVGCVRVRMAVLALVCCLLPHNKSRICVYCRVSYYGRPVAGYEATSQVQPGCIGTSHVLWSVN